MDILWNRLDWRAWNDATPGTCPAIQHCWRYGAVASALGRRVERAEIWHAGRFAGLAQIVTRRAGPATLGLLPLGPLWASAPEDERRVMRELRRTMPGVGMRLLLSAGTGGRRHCIPLMTPAHAALLPLDTVDRMRATMHGKWRNSLAGAARGRLKLSATVPTPAELDAMIRKDRAQAHSRGYRGLPPAFLHAWMQQKGPPPRLYSARAGGEVIAAMLFLDHAPGVTYHLGWSGEAGRSARAHHRLLWRAMCDFARMGRRQIDLGLLDTVNAPGLARFKLGAGAIATDLGPTGLILPAPAFSRWHRRVLRRNVTRDPEPVD